MKRRNVALEHDLDQLHQRRDDEDEDDRLHVRKVDLAREQQMVDGPRDRRREDFDENDREAHARRLIELFRHAEERAYTEEFDQNIVVRDGGGQDDKEHRFHFAAASFPH